MSFKTFFDRSKDKLAKLTSWIWNLPSLVFFILVVLLFIFLVELGIATLSWYTNSKCENTVMNYNVKQIVHGCDCIICDNYVCHILQRIVCFTAQTSVILMVSVFAWFGIAAYNKYRQKKDEEEKNKKLLDLRDQDISHLLKESLMAALAISAIPTGISLIICAFYDMKFIGYMFGVEVYIAFAGISIFAMSFFATLQEETQVKKTIEDRVITPEDITPENSVAGSQSPSNTLESDISQFIVKD